MRTAKPPPGNATLKGRERRLVEPAVRTRDSLELEQALQVAGVPCARVNNFKEVFEHPQIVARGVVQEIEHPRLGTMKVTRNPVLLDHDGPDIARPAPMLGEHNHEILSGLLGLSAAEMVAAAYSCSDPIVSGVVVSCVGTVPPGSNIDTSTLGNHTFTVNATDIADNSSSSSVTYSVTYKILLLYDPLRPPKGGNSTIAIKLQIADANNVNLSSPSIGLLATGIKTAGGTTVRTLSIPFRYDATLPGYIVNISTKGLAAGDYNLTFTVAGDSRVHLAPFRLR
jgi:hypothetical protein